MANLDEGMKSHHGGVCGDCDFFDVASTAESGTINSGRCRRYPPQVTSNGAFAYPVTVPWDWCGEFRQASKVMDDYVVPDDQ